MESPVFRSRDPMTQSEFARWVQTVSANDPYHYELLEGFVVREPPAGWPHGEIEGEVVARLKSFPEARRLGRVFASSQGFELPTGDTVEPDASFVSAERWRALAHPVQGFPPVVPDLVVEILSPSTRRIDQEQKKRIYERNGVREYWLIDPRLEGVRFLVLKGRKFDEDRLLSGGDILRSHVLPGLEIPVAELFPEP